MSFEKEVVQCLSRIDRAMENKDNAEVTSKKCEGVTQEGLRIENDMIKIDESEVKVFPLRRNIKCQNNESTII